MLYTLFAFELAVCFTWCSFVISYPDTFAWITSAWIIGLISLIIALGIIVFSMFSPAVREPPLNLAVYLIFTLTFTYGMGWLSLWSTSGLVYFVVATLTMIALGFMLYAV